MELKKVLLLVCICWFLLSTATVFAQDEQRHLVVWYTNHTNVAYLLDYNPQLKFSGDTLTVYAHGVDTLSLSSVRKFMYGNLDSINGLSITKVDGSYAIYHYDGKTISVCPVHEDANILIATVDGKIMYRRIIQVGAIESISVESFPFGIYIVSINGITHKIVKK